MSDTEELGFLMKLQCRTKKRCGTAGEQFAAGTLAECRSAGRAHGWVFHRDGDVSCKWCQRHRANKGKHRTFSRSHEHITEILTHEPEGITTRDVANQLEEMGWFMDETHTATILNLMWEHGLLQKFKKIHESITMSVARAKNPRHKPHKCLRVFWRLAPDQQSLNQHAGEQK